MHTFNAISEMVQTELDALKITAILSDNKEAPRLNRVAMAPALAAFWSTMHHQIICMLHRLHCIVFTH